MNMVTNNLQVVNPEFREVCDYIAAKGDALFHKVSLMMVLMTVLVLGAVETTNDRWFWILLLAAGLNYWSYRSAERHARDLYNELESR